MKKIFTLLFCLFTIVMVKAQDRINENVYTFQQSSDLITNIVGWKYNADEGLWISNENFIYHKKNSYLNDKRFSKGANSIQVKSFIYNDEIKYVLILAFNGGHYIYPNIREDWVSYTEYMVFSLTKEQLDVILNPIEYKLFLLPCIVYGNYYEKRSENWIIRQIIENDKEFYESKKDIPINLSLCIYGQKISIKKWKDVVRFNFGMINDDILMENSYFEIPINEWNKLNIIN